MKVVRDEEPVAKTQTQIEKDKKAAAAPKVTRWMVFKAKFALKMQLIRLFLIKFFDIREHAYVIFTYELICKHKNPKRSEFIALAKLSRNATVDQIKEKLFTIKPPQTFDERNKPTNECKFNIVDVKIKPVGKIKSV